MVIEFSSSVVSPSFIHTVSFVVISPFTFTAMLSSDDALRDMLESEMTTTKTTKLLIDSSLDIRILLFIIYIKRFCWSIEQNENQRCKLWQWHKLTYCTFPSNIFETIIYCAQQTSMIVDLILVITMEHALTKSTTFPVFVHQATQTRNALQVCWVLSSFLRFSYIAQSSRLCLKVHHVVSGIF